MSGAKMGRAELALAGIAFIWGATFVVVKEALADVSTYLFLALRFTLAAVLLAAVLRGRLGRRGPMMWGGGLFCGLMLFVGYGLQTQGLNYTTASKSAFITGLYVVLVPLLGSLVHQSRPRMMDVGGAVLATLGTALMTGGGLEGGLNAGDVMTAVAAAAFSAHMLAVAHYSRKMDYERLSVMQVAGVAAFSWLAVATVETPRIVWSGKVWFALVTTAVLATALSFLLYTWAQRQTTASRAALIFALEPVFAGWTAWLVAGESWTARSIGGAGLILAGIVVVELKPRGTSAHQEG